MNEPPPASELIAPAISPALVYAGDEVAFGLGEWLHGKPHDASDGSMQLSCASGTGSKVAYFGREFAQVGEGS